MGNKLITSRQTVPVKSTSSYGNWHVGYWYTGKDYKGRQYHQHGYMYFWHKSDAVKWINNPVINSDNQ